MSKKSRQRRKDTRKVPRQPSVIGITANGHIVHVVTNSNYSRSSKDQDNNYRAKILNDWVDNGGLYHDPRRDGPIEAWLKGHSKEIERRRHAYEESKSKPGNDELAAVIKSFAESVELSAKQPSAALQQGRAVLGDRLRNPVD